MRSRYAGATCQSMRGDAIDAAVARVFLEAMRPAQLEVSMAALDRAACDVVRPGGQHPFGVSM